MSSPSIPCGYGDNAREDPVVDTDDLRLVMRDASEGSPNSTLVLESLLRWLHAGKTESDVDRK